MAGFSGDETAPFFGFLGAAAALVFSCSFLFSLSLSSFPFFLVYLFCPHKSKIKFYVKTTNLVHFWGNILFTSTIISFVLNGLIDPLLFLLNDVISS